MNYSTIIFINLLLTVFLFRADSEIIKLRVLQTTDIHSFFDSSDNRHEGGWLRLAAMIKKERSRDSECLLIDCGDTIQGSLAAIASKGEAAIDMLNHLEYDFWVPGNHELDFGLTRYQQLLEKTKIKILNGNFRITGKKPQKFKAWRIIDKKGLKVCVIGMQASFLNHWFKGSDFENYEIDKAYDVLLKEIPKILDKKPHVIILALHQGFRYRDKRGVNEIAEISRRFPEIDLILGGHTHQPHAGRNMYGPWYSQAAYHASHLGVTDILYDTKKRRIKDIQSVLNKAGSEIEKDPAAEKVFEKWRQQIKIFRKEEVVDIKRPLASRGRPGRGSGTAAAVAEAIRQTAESDFAIHGKFTSEDLPVKITEEALFKVIPYENCIFKLTVTRQQLKKIMSEQLFYLKSSSFNGPAGFKVYVDEQKKLKRIELPLNKDFYTLAVNSRVAAGGGGRFPWLKKEIDEGRIKAEEITVNTREALRDFLVKSGSTFKVVENLIYK